MMEKWFIKNKKADFDLIAKNFDISPILARLAINRGIASKEQLEQYLRPSFEYLHNAHSMKDIEKASSILEQKIKEGKAIRIIGDYDVDGVMATYILYSALKQCGANVDYEIPDRIKDGYGINIQIVEQAICDGIDTIITCDNGISAREQVAFGKEQGLTIIITDHHDIPIGEPLPPANAIVNPKQEDCKYPFRGICGAVVAYKLVEVLYEMFGFKGQALEQFLEFVAIATVCDVMDLTDENRIFVKCGLERLNRTTNVGLQELISVNQLSSTKLSAYHLGFVIGPCINASGRLESAKIALRLFLTTERKKASALAMELKTLNEERKDMTEQNLKKAIELVEEQHLLENKVLVVLLKECHESLAGIIAGRLRERYNRPTIVLTKGKEGLKGSGRSIEEYSMFEEISKCKQYLSKFGGHPMAAGLSLPEENLLLFIKALNETTSLTEEDLIPKISFDMVLPFEQISIPLIEEIDILEPYGKGNVKPIFAVKDVFITGARVIGKEQNMLRLTVRSSSSNKTYTAMLFRGFDQFVECVDEKYGNGAFEDLLAGIKSDIVMDFIFYPSINEYNGYESIQIIIQNFR